MDDSSKFKYQSLRAISRRKKLEKWLWTFLCMVAVLMAIAVVFVYTLG